MSPRLHHVFSVLCPLLVCCSFLMACGGGLQLNLVTAVVDKPSKIIVLFDVSSGDGPVGDLEAAHFAVFEGERQLQPGELVVAHPDLRNRTHTVLLLDMSQNPTPADKKALADATRAFIATLPAESHLTVYAFDGDPSPHPLVPKSPIAQLVGTSELDTPGQDKEGVAHGGDPQPGDEQPGEPVTDPTGDAPPAPAPVGDAPAEPAPATPPAEAGSPSSLDAIEHYAPRDPSRDLHGSYKVAMQLLEQQLAASPVHNGALVVVMRGPDLAGRVGRLDIKAAIDANEGRFARIALAVGPQAIEAPLAMFSSFKVIEVQHLSFLTPALAEVGVTIDALGRSFYVVSACSAARAGKQKLKIEARRNVTTGDGRERSQFGTLRFEFDATGFAAGCKPDVPENWAAPPP